MNLNRWIFLITIFVGALLGYAMQAHSVLVQEKVITLSEDEVQECADGGGCVIVTREKLWHAIQEQAQKMAGGCADKT